MRLWRRTKQKPVKLPVEDVLRADCARLTCALSVLRDDVEHMDTMDADAIRRVSHLLAEMGLAMDQLDVRLMSIRNYDSPDVGGLAVTVGKVALSTELVARQATLKFAGAGEQWRPEARVAAQRAHEVSANAEKSARGALMSSQSVAAVSLQVQATKEIPCPE